MKEIWSQTLKIKDYNQDYRGGVGGIREQRSTGERGRARGMEIAPSSQEGHIRQPRNVDRNLRARTSVSAVAPLSDSFAALGQAEAAGHVCS